MVDKEKVDNKNKEMTSTEKNNKKTENKESNKMSGILDLTESSDKFMTKEVKEKTSKIEEVPTEKIVKAILGNLYNLAIKKKEYSNLETLLDILKDKLKTDWIEEKEIKKLKLDKYKKILETKSLKELEISLIDDKYSSNLFKKIAKYIYKKETIWITNSLKVSLFKEYLNTVRSIKDYKIMDMLVIITFVMSIVLLWIEFCNIYMFKLLDIKWIILLFLLLVILIISYINFKNENKDVEKNKLLTVWTLIGNIIIIWLISLILITNYWTVNMFIWRILQTNDHLYNQLRLAKMSLIDLSKEYNKKEKIIQTLKQENQELKNIIIKQEQEKYIFIEKFKNQLIDNIISNLVKLKNQHINPPKKEEIQKQLEKLQRQKINDKIDKEKSIGRLDQK